MELTDMLYDSDNQNGAGNKSIISVCLESEFRAATVTVDGNKVTALEGVTFIKLQAARPSVDFNTESAGDLDADSHSTTVSCFVPKITAAKSSQLSKMQNQPLIVISEDRNDNLRITGDKRDGTKLKFKEITKGQNGYELTFTHIEAAHPPYFVTCAIPTADDTSDSSVSP